MLKVINKTMLVRIARNIKKKLHDKHKLKGYSIDRTCSKHEQVNLLESLSKLPKLDKDSLFMLYGYINMLKKYTDTDNVTLNVRLVQNNNGDTKVTVSVTADFITE